MPKLEFAYNDELGGHVLMDEHGSYILFKEGTLTLFACNGININAIGEDVTKN